MTERRSPAPAHSFRLDVRRPDRDRNAILARPLDIRFVGDELGRRQEALVAFGQAVELYRALSKARPGAFLPTLANRLRGVGRQEEGVAAFQEAVDLYRGLASDNPRVFLPELADSLNQIGGKLFRLGQRDKSITASEEAVEIYRALAEGKPESFRYKLAICLQNLGARRSGFGRWREALGALQEAVDIYRTTTESGDEVFRNLAGSLLTQARVLSEMRRYREAMDCTREGLAAIAPLAEGKPQAFGELARKLRRAHIEAAGKAGCEPDIPLGRRH
jgi:tetratricopeptide (TPR) repeat protein